MTTRTAVAFTLGLVVAAAGVAAGASGSLRLIINGRVASSDVRLINDRPYAPLADVARALNMVVVRRGAAYEMAPPGGASQVEGARQGRIGDWLLACGWRFRVDRVREAAEYTDRYYQTPRTFRPKNAGDTLIVIDATLRNALNQTQTPILHERAPRNTALADTQGHSYAPVDIDARARGNKGGDFAAAAMLPGAEVRLAIVFSVPQGTRPKSLVFTLRRYPTDPCSSNGTDVRVELR